MPKINKDLFFHDNGMVMWRGTREVFKIRNDMEKKRHQVYVVASWTLRTLLLECEELWPICSSWHRSSGSFDYSKALDEIKESSALLLICSRSSTLTDGDMFAVAAALAQGKPCFLWERSSPVLLPKNLRPLLKVVGGQVSFVFSTVLAACKERA